jgi:hypothetical protein
MPCSSSRWTTCVWNARLNLREGAILVNDGDAVGVCGFAGIGVWEVVRAYQKVVRRGGYLEQHLCHARKADPTLQFTGNSLAEGNIRTPN